MTILYSCNQNYVNQTMISICSVMEHHSVWIEFIVISDNLSDLDQNRIRGLVEPTGNRVRFVKISSIPELEEIYTDGVHPRSIYAKLFPDQLTDAERVLYLDSDVIAMAAFTELFSIDLKENVIAGTAMPYPPSVLERQKIKGGTYICDGIVLIDVRQWKRRQLSEKGKEYFRLCHGKPERMSESVMNYVCAGNILLLPPKYHLMPQFLLFDSMKIKRMYRISDYYSQEEIEEAKASPVFIHYMNELYNRPWCKKSRNNRWNHPYREVYSKYQNQLGINQQEMESLPVRTKVTRYLFHFLPFPVFLFLFHKFHKN